MADTDATNSMPQKSSAGHPAPAVDHDAIIRVIEPYLGDLYRFVAREIRYRESLGDLEPGEITTEDIVAEATLLVLRRLMDQPRVASVKGWLWHMALSVTDYWVRRSRERRAHEQIHLEADWDADLPADDELYENYQPDETLTWEDALPDPNTPIPDDIPDLLASQEEVEATLNLVPPGEREVFILRAIEGLSFDEIAAMQRKERQEVERLYRQARERLRSAWADISVEAVYTWGLADKLPTGFHETLTQQLRATQEKDAQ
jgi:RNA polymerase sigma factor (sigma-70 family)